MLHGHPGAQLSQETATQEFVDYPDQMVRAAALATVYRDTSVKSFNESYEPLNKVSQQMLQYDEH